MDQPTPTLEPQPDAPQPPSTSLAARMMNVFTTPGDVFAEIKAAPPCAANWLVPALLLVLTGWVGAWLIFSQESVRQQVSDITNKAIEKQVEKGKLSKEQAESARQVAEKWGSIGTKVSAVAAPVFGAFISPFWWGLILWLFGSKVLKGSFTYLKAVEVAGLANMIGVLGTVVKTLLIVATGNLYASPSLVLLVKEFDPQNTTHSLLTVFNLMTFWLLGVRSVGLARLSGASFGKSALCVFGLWAVLTGLLIGFGLAMKAVFGG